MEEAKAAAYYDELTRKGTGAARFKQGLGFSSSSDEPPKPGEALPSTSSFYSSFVRASANPSELSDYERRSRLESVRDKLRKKDRSPSPDLPLRERTRRSRSRSIERKRRRSRSRSSERRRRSRSRSIERKRRRSRSSSSERRRRSRSRSSERRRSRSRSGERKRRRSRSRSGERKRRRSRSRSGERKRRRSRSRSWERDRRGIGRDNGRRSRSPRRRRREEKSDGGKDAKGSAPDYSRLIMGYSEMSSAERVKAKMKLQLKETAKKDVMKGSNSKWERFDFDKDAPLDDEEIDAAEDDSSLVKDIGQTFRFAAVKAKREDEIKAAHDQAMFGAPAAPLSQAEETADDNEKRESNEDLVKRSTLISDNLVSTMQQGSWRDRVRRAKEAS